MKIVFRAWSKASAIVAVAFAYWHIGVLAQEGDSKPSPAETPAPNALYGLFQMQPQYPTPGTTVMFPEAVPTHLGDDKSVHGRQPGQQGQVFQPGWGQENKPVNPADNKDNPLKGLFQMQPQYPTPGTTVMFPEAVPSHLGDDKSVHGRQPGQQGQVYQPPSGGAETKQEPPSGNKDNLLKGLFQQQPQYVTPGTTVMFPEAIPSHLGDDSSVPGRQPGRGASPHQSSFAQSEESPVQLLPAEKSESAATEPTPEAEKEKAKTEAEKAVSEENKARQEAQEGAADIKKGEEDIKKGREEGNQAEVEKGKKEVAKGKKEEAQAKEDEAKAKKDAESAKKDFEKAKLLEAKEKEARHPLKTAVNLMNEGKYEESLALLNKLINRDAGYAQAYYVRAVLYVSMKRYQDAARDYKAVLGLVQSGELKERASAGLRKIHF